MYLTAVESSRRLILRSPDRPGCGVALLIFFHLRIALQGQAPQPHSPGLVAVQLPNQNSVQLVPAPSIPHQNAVYYAAPNYVTAGSAMWESVSL